MLLDLVAFDFGDIACFRLWFPRRGCGAVAVFRPLLSYSTIPPLKRSIALLLALVINLVAFDFGHIVCFRLWFSRLDCGAVGGPIMHIYSYSAYIFI